MNISKHDITCYYLIFFASKSSPLTTFRNIQKETDKIDHIVQDALSRKVEYNLSTPPQDLTMQIVLKIFLIARDLYYFIKSVDI